MIWPGGGGRSVPPGFPGGGPSPSEHVEDEPTIDPAPRPRPRRFGRRRDDERLPAPPLLQTSYEDETVQDLIEVASVEVPRLAAAPPDEAPVEVDLTEAPTDDAADIGDIGDVEVVAEDVEGTEDVEEAAGVDELDDVEEIDLRVGDPVDSDARSESRRRRPRLSVVWPGESGSSAPPDFPGSQPSVGGRAGAWLSGASASTTPRGLRAVVAAVYAALADPLVGGDEAAREQRAQRVRTAGIVAGSTVLTAVLVYTIFPVRTYLDQRSATQRAKDEIEVLSEANEKLAERAEDLRTPEVVEERARADYGYVYPDEESYRVLPPPVVTTIPPTTTTLPPLP